MGLTKKLIMIACFYINSAFSDDVKGLKLETHVQDKNEDVPISSYPRKKLSITTRKNAIYVLTYIRRRVVLRKQV